jgi:hypothetical protein
MQKKLYLAMIGLMVAVTATAAEKQKAALERVTVFTNGAQVERKQSVTLMAGEQVVTFTDMSPFMDTKSMQVKAKGRLTVLGVSHRTTHPDSAMQVKRLRQAEEAVKAVERSIQQVKDEQEMQAAQLELVKTNCSVASRTVATPLANIKELNNYYAQEVLAVKKRGQELDERLQQLGEELNKKQTVRDSIAKLKLKTVTEIDVKVNAQQAGRADFSITYYVKNAGWFPTYDVRSNSTHEPLQLSYKANIYQNTKEEWKNASVVLSSANPNRSNIAPELKTYWLDFGLSAPRYDTDVEGSTVSGRVLSATDGEPLIGASVIVKGSKIGTVTDIDGAYSITLPQGKRQLTFSYIGYQSVTRTVSGETLSVRLSEDEAALQEVAVIGYGTKKANRKSKAMAETAVREDMMALRSVAVGTAVEEELDESSVMAVEQQQAQFGFEFEIKQPLTLPDGGKTTTTEIARYELPASYEYRGIPKIEKEAFLVARATDWTKLNLLEGEASVYFDNSFVGKSIIDPTVASDTLQFSMGRDPGIRIQRTKVNESSTRRFFGSNQEQTLTWRITAKNTRSEAVGLAVCDQTPVSRNSDIDVSIKELSGGLRDNKTGIVTWALQLQPGEQRELILQYKVKYPQNRRLNIE